MDENISEGPWHLNSQGFRDQVMGREKGEELLQFRAGTESMVIKVAAGMTKTHFTS